MLRATVSGHFDAAGVGREVDELAKACVLEGARRGGVAARNIASRRRKSGAMSAIVVDEEARPLHGERGWRASFASTVKHAWYQNDGTLGSRRTDKPLRHPPAGIRKRGPGTGVRPLRFLDVGLLVGFRAMMRRANGGTGRRL